MAAERQPAYRVPKASNGGKLRRMRPSNKSRSRNKPGNNGSHNNQQRRSSMGNIINRVFESAGPDGKVRGTPQQIIDKYQALARDAQLAGDRVTAESYLQHSEHYSRLLGEAQRQQMENRLNQEREEAQRGSDRDDGGRGEDGFDSQRRQSSMGGQVASGLTMIDPDDPDDMAGPIETPEGRHAPVNDPAPVIQMAPEPGRQGQINGAGHDAAAEKGPAEGEQTAAEAEQPAEAPAKRSRPRRRQKAEAPTPDPVAQTE
jgi:hypothetical protein